MYSGYIQTGAFHDISSTLNHLFMDKKIKTALISVFYKDLLEEIVKKLNGLGVSIISTGGTKEFIEKLGIKVTAVEELTGYPSILGGRVGR